MYQRIRDLREDRDLTQKNMGEILNCSQRIYSNYECGDVDIPTHILIKLAEFHNTSVDYLLNLTDDKRPSSKLNRPHFLYKRICTEIISVIFLHQTDCLIS